MPVYENIGNFGLFLSSAILIFVSIPACKDVCNFDIQKLWHTDTNNLSFHIEITTVSRQGNWEVKI